MRSRHSEVKARTWADHPYEIPNQCRHLSLWHLHFFPSSQRLLNRARCMDKSTIWNNYLATRPTAPVHALADIIYAFNNANAAVAR